MKGFKTTKAISRFLMHMHPLKVNKESIKFTRTFGLGGISALLLVILFITGLLLRFVYIPTIEGAYDSIVDLQNNVLFGSLLRNIHYWSAMLLVIVSFLHLARVFYSMSIYHERRKNWVYGIILMFLVVFANFTGYLLPWDQLSYWAVTIMTNMLSYIPLIGDGLANLIRGGDEVNASTLLRFYNFHTGLLPILMVFFMAIHFWLVRKAKGVAVENKVEKVMVKTNPELVYKEIIAAFVVIIGITLFSMLVNAPLLEKANPLESPNPSKAPWYFMGFQELLMHIHPTFGAFIIPLAVTAFLIYIPYIKYQELNVGKWFNSAKGKQITILSLIFGFMLTMILILVSEKVPDFNTLMPEANPFISTGILSFLLYLIPTSAFLYYLKNRKGIARIDLILSLVTMILTSYLVMTIVGSLFRGEGMQLIF